jgi:hypothetical protein
MEIITKEFTYSVPDVYLSTETSENKTGTVTYNGPDEMYVFVNAKTGKLNWGMHCLINHDDTIQDLATTHAGQDHRAILVTFDQNPLICWAMWGEYDEENASVTQYILDGETEPHFEHFDPIPPHEVYNYDEFVFLFDESRWKTPYPMRTPQRTQEEWNELFAEMLEDVQEKIDADDVNDEYTALMIAHKAELEALPTKYADVPWYMWAIPASPEIKRDGDFEPENDVPAEEQWFPAEDGSEGVGPATNYQPVDLDNSVLPEDSDIESKPAPASDDLPPDPEEPTPAD